MANKYLNIELSSGTVQPMLVTGVTKIVNSQAGGKEVFTLTYESGQTAVMTCQAAAAAVYAPSSAGQRTEVIRALWEQIIKAGQAPWNQNIFPGINQAWDLSVEPASSQASEYVAQSNAAGTVGGGGDSLEAKVSTALLGTPTGGGAVGPMSAFESVA